MHSYSQSTTEREFSEKLSRLTDGRKEVKYLAAFSGGCDSLALLCLLCKAAGSQNVTALYVNHNLRPQDELDAEIELNRENCLKLGAELVIENLGEQVRELASVRGNGLEEAARILRYRAIVRAAEEHGCSFICTAHHRDDQVETLLMRSLRNSPVTSMRGIPERSVRDGITLIRPLLDISRTTLENYLTDRGFVWSKDSTNEDNSIERNRIRNIEIPKLRALEPDFEEKLLQKRRQALRECGDFEWDGSDRVNLEYFRSLNNAQRLIVLYSMWDSVMESQLPSSLIKRVTEAVDSEDSRCLQISANGAVFSFAGGRIDRTLVLTSMGLDGQFRDFEAPLDPESDGLELPGGMRLVISDTGRKEDIRLDPEFFGSDIRVRFYREGDRVCLKDGTKMLTRVLQDMKIPSALRLRVPLIADSLGICAVLGGVWGGRDRIAGRFISSSCARTFTCLKY